MSPLPNSRRQSVLKRSNLENLSGKLMDTTQGYRLNSMVKNLWVWLDHANGNQTFAVRRPSEGSCRSRIGYSNLEMMIGSPSHPR